MNLKIRFEPRYFLAYVDMVYIFVNDSGRKEMYEQTKLSPW